jgi:hypothetical protein
MTSRIDVSCLERSGISAHSRKEQPGYGTVMINEDSDRDRALQILRAQGFEVSGGVGHYPRRVMSWFAGNVRPTSLLTSEAVPLLDAQGARFQTTRLAMMRGSDRACADYQTPTASSCAVQRRGRSIRSVEASAVRFDGCLPAAIISTFFGARNANRINPLT